MAVSLLSGLILQILAVAMVMETINPYNFTIWQWILQGIYVIVLVTLPWVIEED